MKTDLRNDLNNKLIERFNNLFKDDIVRLRLYSTGSVEVFLDTGKSKFLDSVYDKGDAYIYLHKRFFDFIEDFALTHNVSVNYNNTKTIFHFTNK